MVLKNETRQDIWQLIEYTRENGTLVGFEEAILNRVTTWLEENRFDLDVASARLIPMPIDQGQVVGRLSPRRTDGRDAEEREVEFWRVAHAAQLRAFNP